MFAITNPFPLSADAYDIAWKSYAEAHVVQDEEDMMEVDHLLCKMRKDPVFAKENLAVVCKPVLSRSLLTKFQVMRGTSQLRGELKDKARTAIISHYITPMGSDRRLRKQVVSWLLKSNIFVFGSLDFEVCAISILFSIDSIIGYSQTLLYRIIASTKRNHSAIQLFKS